jgi:hypothetical protein
VYGAGAGANDLVGKSNADVAALFQSDFLQNCTFRDFLKHT